jgi:hypothetical protein
MTDGQQFYFLMAVFYLWSCLKAAPPKTLSIHQGLRQTWKLKHPITTLSGLGKAIFLSPLSPWPSSFALSLGSRSTFITASSTLRLVTLTSKATRGLRFTSLLLFLYFFIVLPYTYWAYGDSKQTYICILVCFLLMIACALRFICIHRSIAPNLAGDRYKHAFFAVTMPWHAMRIADEIHTLERVSPNNAHMLAAISDSKESKEWLAQEYRNALYKQPNACSLKALKKVFNSAAISKNYVALPPSEPDPSAHSFCPCCLTQYTLVSGQCQECHDVSLIPKK